MKTYVQPDSELWRDIFRPVVHHVHAATVWEEEYFRVLALRSVINYTPPTYEPDMTQPLQQLIFNNYCEYLRYIKHEHNQRQQHRKRLKARGIPPEQFFLHPYKSRAEKKRDAERLLYIENCLRTGRPIQWDNFRCH